MFQNFKYWASLRKVSLLSIISVLQLIPNYCLAIQYADKDEDKSFSQPTVAFLSNNTSLCSGVFISNTTLLTAKHCVEEIKSSSILLSNFNSGYTKPFEEEYRIDQILKNPGHDIALIKLNQEVRNIKPVSYLVDNFKGYTRKAWYCIVGAGRTEEEKNKKNMFDIQLHKLCENLIEVIDTEDTSIFYLRNLKNLKAGSDHGDSGGPVFLPMEDGPMLVGISVQGASTEDGVRLSGFVDLMNDSISSWVRENAR